MSNYLLINTIDHNYSITFFNGNQLQKIEGIVVNRKYFQELRDDDKNLYNSLGEMLNTLLSQACLDAKELDGVAAVVGPGSYTNLRVGVAFTNALAFAWQKPAIGVSIFNGFISCLNNDSIKSASYLAVTPNYKDGCFAQIYDKQLREKGVPFVISSIEDISWLSKENEFTVLGDGQEVLRQIIKTSHKISYLTKIRKIFSQDWYNAVDNGLKKEQVYPLYIKPPKIGIMN